MWTTRFWKDASERAIKTFAQALVALIVAAQTTNVVALDWPTLIFTALGTALLSILTSLAGPAVQDNTVSPASYVSDTKVLD